jgi:hypothetical protein
MIPSPAPVFFNGKMHGVRQDDERGGHGEQAWCGSSPAHVIPASVPSANAVAAAAAASGGTWRAFSG